MINIKDAYEQNIIPAFFYIFIRILDAIINTWRFVIRNY